MAGKLYGLTQADRDKVKGLLANVNAGKKGPSRRPVATRRRQIAGGGGGLLRVAVVTESGGIDAATLVAGEIVPSGGNADLFERPSDVSDNWPPGDTGVTLAHIGGDVIAEGAFVLIDKNNLIVNQICTPPE